jgi:hypothetical protein
MDQTSSHNRRNNRRGRGNKDFDRKEVKEEFQKSRKIGIIHSGLIRDHQLQLKNDHIESIIAQKSRAVMLTIMAVMHVTGKKWKRRLKMVVIT